ncbi:MAG: putative rane protein [Gemmatimonadetes bacterium]|nr:putative rane protein [Gemmatimonadota bacterium]
MNVTARHVSRFAGGAGVIGATCAALCCAGAPIIVSILAATGLSFLRNDAILLPVIGVALLVALGAFWLGRRQHGSAAPLVLGLVGAGTLVIGVVFTHGVLSKLLIGGGAVLLLLATIWNARMIQSCPVPLRAAPASEP